MTDRLIELRDGRMLGMTAFGDPAVDRLVLFCHPAPGAGGFDPDPAVTNAWGVHVVSVDRPGYGSSTALADDVAPTVIGRADDLAEYVFGVIQQARETGRNPVTRVGVVGWSAGGRIALAFAARHPGLVDRVAVIATPAPDGEVRWVPPEQAARNAELHALPVPEAKQRMRAVLDRGTPGIEVLASGEADGEVLERRGLQGRIERMLHQSAAQGSAGYADDLLSYAGDDWGFDLGDVQAKVLLAYGAKDPLAPSAHGRWYRRRLHDAHLTVVPRAGHLVIAAAWNQVLEHVDPQHGRGAHA